MALRAHASAETRFMRLRPLSRASVSDFGVLRNTAEPTWSDGAFVGFVVGAAFVGALWMLNWSLRVRRRDKYIDPYENVPYDDEELSEEELRQIAESEKEIARGEVYSWEEVVNRRSGTA